MQDLSRLLRPRHIAVAGGTWAENVIVQCQHMNYQGLIWPINPTRTKLAGLPCYKSIAELPQAPDAAFVGVNRDLTIPMVAQLSARGGGGAVCFASGFSEVQEDHAQDLQRALVAAAGPMPILGPNCYGFINYLDNALLWPDEHGGEPVTSGVAIVSQSSDLAINLTMQRRGLPIAYMLTAGNQAQVSLASLGESVLHDDRVTALGLYIEGFGDIRAFEGLAKTSKSLNKPIVVMKAGHSPLAQAVTVTHTASLAGDFAGAKAFLKRLGVPRLRSVSEFLETLKLLHVCGPLSGKRIFSMSCSGGEAALVADAGLDRDIEFSPLSENQRTSLESVLGPKVHVTNPLDYHTYIWNDQTKLTELYSAALKAQYDLTCLILDFPRNDRCTDIGWKRAHECFVTAHKIENANAAAIIALIPDNMPEKYANHLIQNGIAPLAGIEEALTAAQAASRWHRDRDKQITPVLWQPQGYGKTRIPSEMEAKQLLSDYDVRIPRARLVTDVSDTPRACQELGFPVVLKGLGLTHKSENNGVYLNLQSRDDVLQAAENLFQTSSQLLMEEFVTDVIVELLVGIVCDPAVGFILTLGAGGVHTELFEDQSYRLLPVSKDEIAEALGELRIAPQLKGYRGRPGVNLDATIEAIVAISRFVSDHAESVAELEVNPLLLGTSRIVAADALIRLRDQPDD